MSGGPTVATAPGKVMLAGEYAVLDGGLAVMTAVERRAIATVSPTALADPPAPSEFMRAARAAVATACGATAAAGFDRLRVDTAALREADRKLGLGSSAAATVAAIAAVLADAGTFGPGTPPVATIAHLALAAHAEAQGSRGARGSGADIFASAVGGVLGFRRRRDAVECQPITLPADLVLSFAWTGQPADTATLVAAVTAARARDRRQVDRVLLALADQAEALAATTTAADAVAALAASGRHMATLAHLTGVALVPPAVTALAESLAPLGAAAKTTGAGGGDIVLIAAPVTADGNEIERAIIEAGLWPLSLSLASTGVDFRRTTA